LNEQKEAFTLKGLIFGVRVDLVDWTHLR